jgi:surfeit locus 1 family protein
VATLTFLDLCIWQIEHRAWKQAPIAAANERVHAPPQPAPTSAEWHGLDAK